MNTETSYLGLRLQHPFSPEPRRWGMIPIAEAGAGLVRHPQVRERR